MPRKVGLYRHKVGGTRCTVTVDIAHDYQSGNPRTAYLIHGTARAYGGRGVLISLPPFSVVRKDIYCS
ncbi:MAG: hypothetical protein IJB65_08500 [Clostridia bacterium]|nr:hypothetical protein [Clostridia bacterium]